MSERWRVAGASGRTGPTCDTVLASPIILYDYPQIAPESAGDLFDGTEIDEILMLRIMTLTDAGEARDARTPTSAPARFWERTEAMPQPSNS